MRVPHKICLICCLLSACIETARAEAFSQHDQEALQLGRKVLAVKQAIQSPDAADALAAIVALGTDSRYYVMVRGWLVMQLQGDLSIIAASGDDAPADIKARAEFLQKAIRAVDLD